jgi:hypothetical protein
MNRPVAPILRFACGLAVLAAVASAAPAGAATAPDDSVLATFDGGSVYPAEFARTWGRLLPNERPTGDPVDAREQVVRQIVDRKLLAREARKHPFERTHEEEEYARRLKESYLQTALLEHLLDQQPPPRPEDLQTFIRQNKELAQIRFIQFADMASARAWRQRLLTGTPISALDAAIRQGGDKAPKADSARYVAAESIPDTLALVIWSMRPGEVSDIHVFGGVPVAIHVLSFSPRPSPITLSDEAAVHDAFQAKRLERVRQRYRFDVVKDIGRRFDGPNMAFLLDRHLKTVPPRNSVDSLTGMPTIRPLLPLPQVDTADRSRILARTNRDSLSIADYLDYWTRVAAQSRPDVRDMDVLEAAVDRVVLEPELVRRALALGLDRDSTLLAEMARQDELFALEHFYSDQVVGQVVLDPKKMRAYFDSQPGHYDDLEAIDVHMILVDRRSLADSIATRLRIGASFEALARQYSMHAESAEQGGNLGRVVRGQNAAGNVGLEDAMFQTPVGQIGGPESTPSGFVVWRVDARHPAVKRSYEDAATMVERDWRIVESERMLNQLLDRLRREAHVQVYRDHIAPDLGGAGIEG